MFVAAHWLSVPGIDADALGETWQDPLGRPYFGVLPGLPMWLVGIDAARAFAERAGPRPAIARLAAAAWVLVAIPSAVFTALFLEGMSDEAWELGLIGAVPEQGMRFRLVAVLARCAGAALVWQLAGWIRRTELASGALVIATLALGLELLGAVIEAARGASASGATLMAGSLVVAAIALAVTPAMAILRPPSAWPVPLGGGLALRSSLDLALAPVLVGTVAGSSLLTLGDLAGIDLTPRTSAVVVWCAAISVSAITLAVLWLAQRHPTPKGEGARSTAGVAVPAIAALLAPAALVAWSATGAQQSSHPWSGDRRVEATVVAQEESAAADSHTLEARIEHAGIEGRVEVVGPARMRIVLEGVRDAGVLQELLAPQRFGVHVVIDETSDGGPGARLVPRRGVTPAHLEGTPDALAAIPGLERAIECDTDEADAPCSAWAIEAAALSNDDLAGAEVLVDPMTSVPYVSLRLSAPATQTFARLTARHTGDWLALVIDGRALTVARVQRQIDGGRVQITMGGYLDFEETAASARALADALTVGAPLEGDWTLESTSER